jgi:flotillin
MTQAVLAVVVVIAVLFVFLMLYASRYVKVGPNQVLVISGRRRTVREKDGTDKSVGFRIVKGGGAFVWPVFEKAEVLSLEIMTLDVKLPEVYTITGVPIMVDGVAQIKVRGEDISIATAAE